MLLLFVNSRGIQLTELQLDMCPETFPLYWLTQIGVVLLSIAASFAFMIQCRGLKLPSLSRLHLPAK
jgi:hypothetical protein